MYNNKHYIGSLLCRDYKCSNVQLHNNARYLPKAKFTHNNGRGNGTGSGMGKELTKSDRRRISEYLTRHKAMGVDLIVPDEEITDFNIMLTHQ